MFQVLTEVKESAAKRRRQSTRLENLGIPEEELLRQQQELFAKVDTSELTESQRSLIFTTAGPGVRLAPGASTAGAGGQHWRGGQWRGWRWWAGPGGPGGHGQ